MRTVRFGVLAATLLLAAPRLLAHHSFAAFDMSKEQTITGVVSRFDWTTPHTFIWVDVANDKGVVESWGIEGMSPNYLGRRGWSKNCPPGRPPTWPPPTSCSTRTP